MTDNDSDDVTQDYPKPLPLEQLAPAAPHWSHDQALHYASIAVQPELYDPNHAGLIKLAAAYLELSKQHSKLADRLDEMRAAPEDIERLMAQASHQAFRNVYPMTAEAMLRVVKKQVDK